MSRSLSPCAGVGNRPKLRKRKAVAEARVAALTLIVPAFDPPVE